MSRLYVVTLLILLMGRGKRGVQGIERDGHQVLRKEQETKKEN